MTLHPLDRPIWHALRTRQAHLALGAGKALRHDRDYAMFAAAEDDRRIWATRMPPRCSRWRRTEPGPFFTRTHQLGDFVGVRHEGRLIAMAGERLKLTGCTEVSGVCTHPDFRGCGLAAALIRIVAGRIMARGEAPFLHAYADNKGAIALYEALGFRIRTEVTLAALA